MAKKKTEYPKSKKHPENLEDTHSADAEEGLTTYVTELASDIEEERGNLREWNNAVDRLTRLRFGARRRKNHPWPGAANFVIPVIDSKIEKVKPSYINLAFGVSPIVTFEPYGPEDVEPARMRELLFDWRMRTQVKMFKPYCVGVDQILSAAGMTVFRIIWKFKSRRYNVTLNLADMNKQVLDAIYDVRVNDEMLERIIKEHFDIDLEYEENEKEIMRAVEEFRKGTKKIELTLFETEEDRPEVIACDVSKDLVVPIDTKDLNDSRFIDYQWWVSKNELKNEMLNGKYAEYSDADLTAWAGHETQKTVGSMRKTSVNSDDMILMHETCCWYDINDDGIEERCIWTWPDADCNAKLRFIEMPYDHGKWPYVQVKREIISDYFYFTRGYPSLDEDFQTGISTAVNQAVDNGTLLNMPERVAVKNSLLNPRSRRFIPGELTEVNGPLSNYETRVYGNQTQPILFQQAQYLKGWSDQRTGNIGAAFSGSTDLPGLGDRGKKTAKEVDAISFEQSQAHSLDLLTFQNQMAEVYWQIDALYNQYGSDEEHIIITGQPPARISRDDIQGRFDMVPNGRLDNATPDARLRKKMVAYNIGVNNPLIKQRELINEIYRDLDPRLAQIVVKTKEEISQEMQQQQAQAIEAENEGIKKALGLKRIKDDMEVRKEALLTPIAGRRFAAG